MAYTINIHHYRAITALYAEPQQEPFTPLPIRLTSVPAFSLSRSHCFRTTDPGRQRGCATVTCLYRCFPSRQALRAQRDPER